MISGYADGSTGESLERQMWADIKSKNWTLVEQNIASDFQSIHTDGARDKVKEMILIKNLNVGAFTLSNFKVTEGPGIYIITYNVSANETVDNQRLPVKQTPRLSVWRNSNGKWQWSAHANLNPIPITER